jgi:hypothetical protein
MRSTLLYAPETISVSDFKLGHYRRLAVARGVLDMKHVPPPLGRRLYFSLLPC